MRKCRVCKSELRAGRSWEEEHDGKRYRYIHLVCMNKGCTNYKQVLDTEVKEIESAG